MSEPLLDADERECDSCGFPEPDGEQWRNYNFVDKQLRLCELCAGTLIGNSAAYPNQYPERAVLASIAYIGNAIITEIRKLQR